MLSEKEVADAWEAVWDPRTDPLLLGGIFRATLFSKSRREIAIGEMARVRLLVGNHTYILSAVIIASGHADDPEMQHNWQTICAAEFRRP